MIGYVQIVSLMAAVLLFCMYVASVVLGVPDSVQSVLPDAAFSFAILQWFCSLERRLGELEKRNIDADN